MQMPKQCEKNNLMHNQHQIQQLFGQHEPLQCPIEEKMFNQKFYRNGREQVNIKNLQNGFRRDKNLQVFPSPPEIISYDLLITLIHLVIIFSVSGGTHFYRKITIIESKNKPPSHSNASDPSEEPALAKQKLQPHIIIVS